MGGDRVREGGPREFHPSKRDSDVTVVAYHTWIRPGTGLRILICAHLLARLARKVTLTHGSSIPSRSPLEWGRFSRNRANEPKIRGIRANFQHGWRSESVTNEA